MRVVIGTNVFISSFFGGKPREIINLWKEGKIIICLTPPVIEEYVEVLKRLGLDGESELKELIDFLAKGYNICFRAKTPSLQVVDQDPADNKFIEAAVGLRAKVIISGDKHLLALREYLGLRFYPRQNFYLTLNLRERKRNNFQLIMLYCWEISQSNKKFLVIRLII
jgi:conserved hypothetical protein TIGR00305